MLAQVDEIFRMSDSNIVQNHFETSKSIVQNYSLPIVTHITNSEFSFSPQPVFFLLSVNNGFKRRNESNSEDGITPDFPTRKCFKKE